MVSDHQFSKKQIIHKEYQIFESLNFQIFDLTVYEQLEVLKAYFMLSESVFEKSIVFSYICMIENLKYDSILEFAIVSILVALQKEEAEFLFEKFQKLNFFDI